MYGQIKDHAEIKDGDAVLVYVKDRRGPLDCLGLFYGREDRKALKSHCQNDQYIVMPYCGFRPASPGSATAVVGRIGMP